MLLCIRALIVLEMAALGGLNGGGGAIGRVHAFDWSRTNYRRFVHRTFLAF